MSHSSVNAKTPPWAIRPVTPEEVYTDRAEHLEYLYEYALKAVTRRSMSTVLLGRRRMGKTEIFKRVVNRLFFEQEHYRDLRQSAVPVYFCFEDKPTDEWRFAEKYSENFLRWYAAFRLRDPDILSEKLCGREDLTALAKNKIPESVGLRGTLKFLNILGRGSLFGRFRSEPIRPLTEYWGAELALRSARYYQAELPEGIAPVVAARCGGNPFYVSAVVQQAAEQGKTLSDEKRINEILAVDLSSGFIWGELNDQVGRWIERVNEHGVTKWVLYLSALEEGEWIDPERIRSELRERDGRDVPVETVRDTLVKLSR